jgi:hypothetical protein
MLKILHIKNEIGCILIQSLNNFYMISTQCIMINFHSCKTQIIVHAYFIFIAYIKFRDEKVKKIGNYLLPASTSTFK